MWGSFLGQREHEDWRFPSSTRLHPIYSTLAHSAALTQPQIHLDATENAGFLRCHRRGAGEARGGRMCSMPSVLWNSIRGSPGTFCQWDKDERSVRGSSQAGWWHRSRRAVLSCCKESHCRPLETSSSVSLWWQMLKIICVPQSCHHLGVVLFTALLWKNKDLLRKRLQHAPRKTLFSA